MVARLLRYIFPTLNHRFLVRRKNYTGLSRSLSDRGRARSFLSILTSMRSASSTRGRANGLLRRGRSKWLWEGLLMIWFWKQLSSWRGALRGWVYEQMGDEWDGSMEERAWWWACGRASDRTLTSTRIGVDLYNTNKVFTSQCISKSLSWELNDGRNQDSVLINTDLAAGSIAIDPLWDSRNTYFSVDSAHARLGNFQ